MPRRVSTASLALQNQPHALYRFFDRSDVLLYVGITADLPARIKNHSKGKPWWTQIHNITVEHFDTRQDALDAERKSIREEKPLHNAQHNPHVWVTDLPDPKKIDGKWITDNWGKVNPCIRDYVEMPAWHHGRLELAEQVLENYSDGDVAIFAQAAKAAAKKNDEEEPAGDELVVASAVEAFQDAFEDRARLISALTKLLRCLLADNFDNRLSAAAAEVLARLGDDHSEIDAVAWLADLTSMDLDAAYFDQLAKVDRDRWHAAAMNLDPHPWRQRDLRSVAGRYARRFRQERILPMHLCEAMPDGICVNQATQVVRLFNCPRCNPAVAGECPGHRIWCDMHLGEAVASNRWETQSGAPFMVASMLPANAGAGGDF